MHKIFSETAESDNFGELAFREQFTVSLELIILSPFPLLHIIKFQLKSLNSPFALNPCPDALLRLFPVNYSWHVFEGP
jgi:hypothetical protein